MFVPLNNASYIFVIGGWDANLDYVNVVEVIFMRTQIGVELVFVIVFRLVKPCLFITLIECYCQGVRSKQRWNSGTLRP